MKGRKAKAHEQEWMDKARQVGCICCILDGYITPYEVDSSHTTIHHIRGKTRPDAHLLTIPLCPDHHQHGRVRIHGTKKAFVAKYGTELELLEKVKEIVSDSIIY